MKTKLPLVLAIMALPFIYLAFIWRELPAIVPMHYNLQGEIDKWGPKESIFYIVGALTVVNAFVYLLLTNLHRIKTKLNPVQNRDHLQRIAIGISCFFTIVLIWILYTAKSGGPISSIKVILICTSLLFSFVGNYLYNIKPNYFAGFRLPWTLKNNDNWRQTHHFASRLWFAGGLLSALICLFLSLSATIALLTLAFLVMLIMPFVYSYRLYKKSKA